MRAVKVVTKQPAPFIACGRSYWWNLCGLQVLRLRLGLEAVDGTSVILPQTQALAKEFGVHKSHNSEMVMAKYLVRVDLLNKYLLQTEVFATTKHEISILKETLWRLSTRHITLFDRGFASTSIFAYMVQHQKPFVCRLKVGFNQVVKNFVANADTDKMGNVYHRCNRNITPTTNQSKCSLGGLKPKIMTLFLTHQPDRIIAELITFLPKIRCP